jgi:sugar transferase (PEP-CTERM/EpsH1 system associated)
MTARPPIRVLHVLPQLQLGGMEQGVIKLLNGLSPGRVVGGVCSFESRVDGVRGLIDPRVPVHVLGRRRGNDPALVWRLTRLLRQWRPDVVHSHSWGTLCEGYVAARVARVPYFVHGEHGTMDLRARNLRVQRWVWRRADGVMAVSSRLADRMARLTGFPRERVTVIRNGADMTRFSTIDRTEARRRLAITDSAFVVGTVGRLVPVKDHETLFGALARLKRTGVAPLTLIAGDGPLRLSLAERTRALDLDATVRFLGDRTDVECVLAAMDVFVLTSESEGLPNTVLEAMASGLPVVATDVGGVDELVDDGRTGLLAPSKDCAAVADAIARLAADAVLRRRMGEAGRITAASRFGLKRMLDDYDRFYADLVNSSKSSGTNGRST